MTNPEPPVTPGLPEQPTPATRRHKLWPWAVGAAVVAVLALCAGLVGAVVNSADTAKPKVAARATPTSPSSPLPVIIGGPCSPNGVTGTTADGDAVTCQRGSWIAPAPEPTEEPDGNGKTVPLGETLVVTGDAEVHYTVVKVEQKTTDKYGLRADKGVYLLAYVKVQVIEGSDYICSCSFSFVTAAGKVYDTTYASFRSREELDAVDVAAGQSVDGWIVFDLPKSAIKGGKIQLRPDAFEELYGYWKV